MNSKEQIMIDGVNIIGTIDEWARLVAHEWCTDEYSDAEIIKNYILDINRQLARKTQECEQQQKTLDELIGCVSLWEEFTEEESKLAKDSSIADLIMLLRKKTQEYDELKKELNGSEKWRIKAESLNEKLDIKNTRYRKVLDEIEEVTKVLKKDICNNCGWNNTDGCNPTDNVCGELINILDIINKAKGR